MDLNTSYMNPRKLHQKNFQGTIFLVQRGLSARPTSALCSANLNPVRSRASCQLKLHFLSFTKSTDIDTYVLVPQAVTILFHLEDGSVQLSSTYKNQCSVRSRNKGPKSSTHSGARLPLTPRFHRWCPQPLSPSSHCHSEAYGWGLVWFQVGQELWLGGRERKEQSRKKRRTGCC